MKQFAYILTILTGFSSICFSVDGRGNGSFQAIDDKAIDCTPGQTVNTPGGMSCYCSANYTCNQLGKKCLKPLDGASDDGIVKMNDDGKLECVPNLQYEK